jgi:hypothetical protein
MRRIFALIMAVGLVTVMATPGTAVGVDLTKPVVQLQLESVFEDATTDPRTTGITYVSGKLTVTDMATFTGIMHGTSLTVVSGNGYEGTWEGTWEGKLVNGVGFFKAVAHGTGDLAGLKMEAEFSGTDPGGPVDMEGRILDPHGS